MMPYNALKALKPEKMTDADVLKCHDLCRDLEAHLFNENERESVLVYLSEIIEMLRLDIERRGIVPRGCDGWMGGTWSYPDDEDWQYSRWTYSD